TVILRANRLPYWLCQDSCAVAPGSGAVPSSIALGCGGVGTGVILSFWASAGVASAQVAAMSIAASRAGRDIEFISVPLVIVSLPGSADFRSSNMKSDGRL